MSFPGDFHFIRPAWLLLAPLVVWLWLRVRKSQDPLRGWRAVIAVYATAGMPSGTAEFGPGPFTAIS